MIDTVGWKIRVQDDLFNRILKKSKERSEIDHSTGEFSYRILKKDINIGSFDNKITVKCNDLGFVGIEFSLPKVIYGNNVELLYPTQIVSALEIVYDNLVDNFGEFPSYKNWYIQRLDLCYAWKFDNVYESLEALKVIESLIYPRKTKHLYKGSVMWSGRTYSLKFYLKHPEYMKHDYVSLLKRGHNTLANNIRNLSKTVLRYEITFRKQSLFTLFGKNQITYRSIIDSDLIESILSRHLKKLLSNLSNTFMEDTDVMKCLKQLYSERTSIRLYSFYKLYFSDLNHQRQMLVDHYNPSTIWRNKSQIAKAGVGLPYDKSLLLHLDIPSRYVVNPEDA